MRLQIFELILRNGFLRITFFRKVKDSNIYSKKFLDFYSARFVI